MTQSNDDITKDSPASVRIKTDDPVKDNSDDITVEPEIKADPKESSSTATASTVTLDAVEDGINNELIPEGEKRDQWSGKLEFLMSCISVSVGLGNVWRFPFTAYENGGGAFLIPYIIVLFVIGKPMYYMEALLGQFSSRSSVKIWSAVPAFLGVGIGQAFAGISILTYYSSLIALTVYYFIGSFKSPLPWSYCREEWGSTCVDSAPKSLMTFNTTEERLQSSSELYFIQTVLRELDDISEGIGAPSWRLTLTLLGTWIITFLVIIRGIRSLGKVAYFLALFPYTVLIALLIRAVTLEGASNGIIFFLKPQWGELLNVKVWKEAIVQCFFSLSVAFGPIVTFSSYNNFRHNVYRDAMIVTTLDTFTSLLAGITIFGILGNLAHNLNTDNIGEVVRTGTGLAFISYPDAIAKFKSVPQIFAVLFFFMLFVLGIGSLVALQSSIVTIICDQFKIKKFWTVSLGICITGFCVGIMYVTPGGQWILNLVDHFAGTFVILVLAVFEIIGIMWIYGAHNFVDDVEFMTERKISIYWRLCWLVITPVLLILIFLYTMVMSERLMYGDAYYPIAVDIAGWIVLAVGFIQFPIWAIWYFSRHQQPTFCKTIKQGLKPNAKWGPTDIELNLKWKQYKQQKYELRKKERESKNIGKTRQMFNFLFGISQ